MQSILGYRKTILDHEVNGSVPYMAPELFSKRWSSLVRAAQKQPEIRTRGGGEGEGLSGDSEVRDVFFAL